ncbi:chaoptin [Euwallacea fornicatus]|uniref:chaoptin n=1 Tax=Euwallacea fornicatus TaxID=995702 RepID=UPI00338DB0BC
MIFFISLLSLLIRLTSQEFVPCQEISPELRFPCSCALGPLEAALENNPSLSIDCDNIVFPSDAPFLPFGAPVVSYRQRYAGHQVLPSQIFTSSLPLRALDLSHNALRKLTERMLHSVQNTLTELKLGYNLLGDTLNPIFSTNEFRGLKYLNLLDLSGNGIKTIEEGILEGCLNLKELYLDNNDFRVIPSTSLNGPTTLKLLSLRSNNIGSITLDSFSSRTSLETVDLTDNLIATIDSGAFLKMGPIRSLLLSHNRLTKFNSDVFLGAENLSKLDLSENFITEFPTVSLRVFKGLRHLNLSSNLVQTLDNSNLASLASLHQLDLSRNSLTNIVPGTFLGLKQLRKLDISVNSLRTVEDDAFEGLDNLEHLNLKDNNILLIPASALGRLPRLTSLQLDYNRITALSGDILSSIAERIEILLLSTNVVRELPADIFQDFKNLRYLDLRRNWLTVVNAEAFLGLQDSLRHLYLSENRIMTLPDPPIELRGLATLDLSNNHLTELPKSSFQLMPSLTALNLSNNMHLHKVPTILLRNLTKLEVLDMSNCGLQSWSSELLLHSTSLVQIRLSHNNISELPDNSLVNMPNLTSVDLSYNNISTIKQSAFVFVMNIKMLNLKGNLLSSFKGEYFNTGTSLEILDLSENQLSYLFPSSFRIHPRLKQILARKNKLNFFPAEVIANLQFLELIDLSHNELKSIDELDFARLPRLRSLLLSNNKLESLSEMAFHNSTQLQVLDLSHNKLDRLGERTFEGLIRLQVLNVANNNLADLPDNIFERARLQMLDNVVLSRNKFVIPPLKALQRQYFFLDSVDLSHNNIEEIPEEDGIMVNIKKLDFSHNPLSPEAVANILSEPKTVRSLNLAHTGISEISRLETPFLKQLNISFNNISKLSEGVFERTTLLEELDVSHNKISSPKVWKFLRNLRTLNLSNNPIEEISGDAFEELNTLRYLSLHSLEECSKIEKTAFKHAPNLRELSAYGYPKLGYLDINGVLQNMPLLERVMIETKDAAIGKDQLQSMLHPRLKELSITGFRLKSVSSGTLSGIKGPEVLIRLLNTSLTSIPPALFFPVPRSSKTILDVTGNQLTTLSVQLLNTLEDRRGDLKLIGLQSNPIICDCNSRVLRRWLPSHMMTIKCHGPPYLAGKFLGEIGDNELTCDTKKMVLQTTTIQSSSVSTDTTRVQKKTTELDIIWSMPATEKSQPKVKTASSGQSTLNNDDTLIIGIVGGVVAFIAILIIIICIIRLRMSSSQYRGGPVTTGSIVAPGMIGSGSSCACSVKGAPAGSALYAVPPSYAATLPHKMAIHQQGVRVPSTAYSTMGRGPYYQQGNVQPYFIATYPSDDKIYR